MKRFRNVSKEKEMSKDPNIISLDHYPKKFEIQLNKQKYNARQLAKLLKGGGSKVPHSRRAMTPDEIRRIWKLTGHEMSENPNILSGRHYPKKFEIQLNPYYPNSSYGLKYNARQLAKRLKRNKQRIPDRYRYNHRNLTPAEIERIMKLTGKPFKVPNTSGKYFENFASRRQLRKRMKRVFPRTLSELNDRMNEFTDRYTYEEVLEMFSGERNLPHGFH